MSAASARRYRRRRPRADLIALLALGAALVGMMAGAASAQEAPSGYELVPIGEFDRPTSVEQAPGSPELVFVVERSGRIRLLRNERPIGRPFLNIHPIVRSSPDDSGAGGEQGLLSIAFAPDHEQSGLFYVYFTNNRGDIEVDEFRRDPENPLRADHGSRRRVIVIPHREAQNHNGGRLTFTANGSFLLFATGDGGNFEPIGDRARDLTSLLGKLIRIDPEPAGGRPYRIPRSNPLVDRPGRDEIFAYGLRNPFRISIDGGRIAIGDVGQGSVEEINLLRLGRAHGANFGWPAFEGDAPFAPDRPGPDPETFPIHTYEQTGGACAVTGGYVVDDPGLPDLRRRYLYGDFCTGELRSFFPHEPAQEAIRDAPLGITAPLLTSFGEGVDGQIYVAQLSGEISRLEAAGAS